MKSVDELVAYVNKLHDADAIHVKRGFRLSEATAADASCHMLEEAVKLQAEVLQESQKHGSQVSMNWRLNGIIEEAADTLICYLHLLRRTDVTINMVAECAIKKLETVFTTDPDKVTAVKPGVTRKARA